VARPYYRYKPKEVYSMRSSLFRASVLAAFLLLAASACSKSTTGGSPSAAGGSPSASGGGSGKIAIGSDSANDKGSKVVTGAASTELELNDEDGVFYMEPTVLMGSPGQSLTIELKNESKNGTLHNFSLTEQNIDMDVQAEQSGSVTVTFPQSGFLEFFCKYHRTIGMVGELTT
jgi:plastocyanin